MLRLNLLAAAAFFAYRALLENLPRIPRGFDLPGGAPPAGDGKDRVRRRASGRTRKA